MTDFDTARLIYLGLLLAAIGASVVLHFRGRLGQALQGLAIWALIFLGLVAAFGLWGDISRDFGRQAVFTDEGRVEVPRSPDGHYHLTLAVNGTPVEFLVDTGASDIVLSQRDAAAIGLDPDSLPYLGLARTANGTVSTARVTLDEVRIGPHTDRNVSARVNGGEMRDSLLGMRYLDRYARIEIADDRLTLIR